MGRGINKFILDENEELSNNIIKEKFELVKDHTLLYNEHSYFFNNIIKEDINNLNKKEIKKKLCNYKYIKIFLNIF